MPDDGYPLARIREEFPVLRRSMRGRPLVYLDSAATALKPHAVINAEVDYLTRIGANVRRGVYELSEEATELYDRTRLKVARFVNATDDSAIVFTRNATEAINIVAYCWGRTHLRKGDEVVLTEVEHHANLVPWQETARATGAQLRFVDLGPGGEISEGAVAAAITERTRMVAITGMSNVTGYRPPLSGISRIVHQAGALLLVDGAQLAGHHPVDVRDFAPDFFCFSGHKMCGPTGVGVLYGRTDVLDRMPPLLYGGDMILRVEKESATYQGVPEKFEAGTPNIAGVIGLGAAVDYLASIGLERIAAHERMLHARAVERLAAIPDVTVHGPAGEAGLTGILSFNVADIHPHDVGTILDDEGVAVRAGFHCAQPFMRRLGVTGTVRASFYLYNGADEVARLEAAVRRAREVFR